MKKLVVFLFGFLLVSCSHEFTTYSEQEIKEIQYEQAFEKAFGKISPTQTWGFNQLTRSANTNSNEWVNVPSEITAEEISNVLDIFSVKGNESYTSLVNWNKFYVQQVYKGVSQYTNYAGGVVTGSEHMDWLCTVTNKQVEVISWWPYEERINIVGNYDDHINNFNNGNGSIMLMVNTDSHTFGFKSSEDNGHVFYNFRMEEINGSYYVGFDFEANGNNPNEQVDRDYIYDDWIVKIVPAIDNNIKEEGRIICEDLGTIGDFDFNDIVFDATIYEDGTTEIVLLAAGGILDISVDGVNVGEVMGKMVNTGLTKVNTYYFESKNKYNNLVEIPIVVTKTDEAGNVTSYELSAEMGKAPQKICVPKTFRWCKEYKSIKDAYPGFTEWVTEGKFWNGEVNNELIY